MCKMAHDPDASCLNAMENLLRIVHACRPAEQHLYGRHAKPTAVVSAEVFDWAWKTCDRHEPKSLATWELKLMVLKQERMRICPPSTPPTTSQSTRKTKPVMNIPWKMAIQKLNIPPLYQSTEWKQMIDQHRLDVVKLLPSHQQIKWQTLFYTAKTIGFIKHGVGRVFDT